MLSVAPAPTIFLHTDAADGSLFLFVNKRRDRIKALWWDHDGFVPYLDVFVYVKDVLDRLLAGETNYDSLRPDVRKQAHPEAVRVCRVEERDSRAEAKTVTRARRRLAKRG